MDRLNAFGDGVLAALAADLVGPEVLVDAILATRHCLGPFRLLGTEQFSQDLDPQVGLEAQLVDDDPERAIKVAPTYHPLGRTIRYHSLEEAREELWKPGRLLVYPSRKIERMMRYQLRFRSIGLHDYEVSIRTDIEDDLDWTGAHLAAIFEWTHSWDEEWKLTEFELCCRLRMLIVRAFQGEAFLIAKRESESADCPVIKSDVRYLEWHEKHPLAAEPAETTLCHR